jgi:hypothetical protein
MYSIFSFSLASCRSFGRRRANNVKKNFQMTLAALALSLTACGEENEATTISNERVVRVESSPTLPDRIRQGGFGFGANDDLDSINEAFRIQPISADYDARFVLVMFNRFIATEAAFKEFQNLSLRPANIAECLAYGAAVNQARRFDLQPPRYAMVCLGSNKNPGQTQRFLQIGGWGDRMVLANTRGNTTHYQYDWSSDTVFLAVRP